MLAALAAALALAAAPSPDFLATNAKAEGVVTLPGPQYKVLRSGPADGAHPKRSDDVTVRYEGRFIDGKLFDASSADGKGEAATVTFPLQKLIPGWIAVVQLMRPGDVWMVYLPPYMAYGAAGTGPIPPNSVLVFKIELVSAAPHVDKPAS